MRTLTLIAALVLAAGPALAGPVTLRANPVDEDGRVTLGDIFEGAGAASGVVVASRAGPSVVFEAGQLQALAARSGLQWSNPQNLRRVVVRNAALAPGAVVPAAASAARPAAPAGATMSVLTYARNLAAGEIAIEVSKILFELSEGLTLCEVIRVVLEVAEPHLIVQPVDVTCGRHGFILA